MNFNVKLFTEELNKLGLTATEEQINKLDIFAGMLIEKNKVMNLTAITDPDGIAVKHFADSIDVMAFHSFKKGEKVLDLGTGAGFPGIPLLIFNPEIDLYLMDATGKKLDFINEVLSALGLKATTIHARAEEAGKDIKLRESFDTVVSRAVASLNTLSEYCIPFVKKGGMFISMKGAAAEEEIKAGENAIKLLGGKIKEKNAFELSDGQRNIIVIDKIQFTPEKYPRAGGVIKKRPL